MFIAIVGTRFSGRSSVENYLVSSKGFTPVRVLEVEGAAMNRAFQRHDPRTFEEEMSSESNSIADGDSIDGFPKDATGRIGRFSFLSMGSPNLPSQAYSDFKWEKEGQQTLCFNSHSDLLDHVTRNWRSNFVTLDIDTRELVEIFVKRPFFMLISVDAPLLERYRRSQRHGIIPLDAFVREHDNIIYGTTADIDSPTFGNKHLSLHSFRDLVNMHIVNSFTSIFALHRHLDNLDILNSERLRPNWDTYFMAFASLVSRRSNCMKRRVGAILVRQNRIVATGYNGTPRGLPNCNEGGCAQCNNGGPHECICLHAEENVLLEAGRDRVGVDGIMYCNTCPCLRCTVKIIQTGVREVVYNLSYKVDEESAKLFKQAGVELRRYNPKMLHRVPIDDSLQLEDLTFMDPGNTISD